MANKITKAQVLKIIENMLYAKRNGNVALEQKYYEQLEGICESLNCDFAKTMEQGIKMVRSRIAPMMNGI